MDLKEKLELAIEAAVQRRNELEEIKQPSTCLFCTNVGISCIHCPVHNGADNPLFYLLQYPCDQYCSDITKIVCSLDEQIDTWERELREIESKE